MFTCLKLSEVTITSVYYAGTICRDLRLHKDLLTYTPTENFFQMP